LRKKLLESRRQIIKFRKLIFLLSTDLKQNVLVLREKQFSYSKTGMSASACIGPFGLLRVGMEGNENVNI
jgi:hypothetical protein